MKIAVVGVRGIPTDRGEIERYCQEFYPRIAARGHQVDLFIQSSSHQQSLFSVSYYHSVRVITLRRLPLKHINYRLCSAFSAVWASFGNYDVIHIHGIKAAWFSWFPKLFSASKIVITIHQLDNNFYPTKGCKILRWLLSSWEKLAVKNADEIIVISKALGEYFHTKYNISPRYIPNAPGIFQGTNLKFDYGFSLDLTPKKYLLCLGKLNPKSRPDLLLQAYQRLENQSWKLVIAGEICDPIRYAVELLSLAQDNPNIVFTNEIRGRHLAEIIGNAGLLVVPSDGSDLGLPLSMLEAMQRKIPVLASDNPVHNQLIGADRGLLFESESLGSLQEKLQYALSKPDELAEMAHKAQTYININHNWDRVTYGNLSLYLKITEEINSSSVQHNF